MDSHPGELANRMGQDPEFGAALKDAITRSKAECMPGAPGKAASVR